MDLAISTCRFRYIDLSIFCYAQARNKNPLNTVVPYPLRRAFHRYGTTVTTVMEHSCSKGIQLSVKGLRGLKGLKGLYIFCTSASFVMVSGLLRDDYARFVNFSRCKVKKDIPIIQILKTIFPFNLNKLA